MQVSRVSSEPKLCIFYFPIALSIVKKLHHTWLNKLIKAKETQISWRKSSRSTWAPFHCDTIHSIYRSCSKSFHIRCTCTTHSLLFDEYLYTFVVDSNQIYQLKSIVSNHLFQPRRSESTHNCLTLIIRSETFAAGSDCTCMRSVAMINLDVFVINEKSGGRQKKVFMRFRMTGHDNAVRKMEHWNAAR